MSFEPRCCFRYSPSHEMKERVVRELPDGEKEYRDLQIDCAVEVSSGSVLLSIYVMENDSMDFVNEIVFTKRFSSSAPTGYSHSRGPFPKAFLEGNPRIVDSLKLLVGRADQEAADFLWSVFVELEINIFLEAEAAGTGPADRRGSVIQDYFPKVWESWKATYWNRKMAIVERIMGS